MRRLLLYLWRVSLGCGGYRMLCAHMVYRIGAASWRVRTAGVTSAVQYLLQGCESCRGVCCVLWRGSAAVSLCLTLCAWPLVLFVPTDSQDHRGRAVWYTLGTLSSIQYCRLYKIKSAATTSSLAPLVVEHGASGKAWCLLAQDAEQQVLPSTVCAVYPWFFTVCTLYITC